MPFFSRTNWGERIADLIGPIEDFLVGIGFLKPLPGTEDDSPPDLTTLGENDSHLIDFPTRPRDPNFGKGREHP